MVNDDKLKIISSYKLDCYRRSFATMLTTYKLTYIPLLLSQFGAFDVVSDEILYYPINIFDVGRILLQYGYLGGILHKASYGVAFT